MQKKHLTKLGASPGRGICPTQASPQDAGAGGARPHMGSRSVGKEEVGCGNVGSLAPHGIHCGLISVDQ